VAATPAPRIRQGLLKWRQIATATVLGAILLPCIAWGIGTMRADYRQTASNSPDASGSGATQPSTAIASTDMHSEAAQILPELPTLLQ